MYGDVYEWMCFISCELFICFISYICTPIDVSLFYYCQNQENVYLLYSNHRQENNLQFVELGPE